MTEELTVIACLERAIERDELNGGDGSRTTREVADYCSLSLATARRKLWAEADKGFVEVWDGGNTLEWQLVTI